MYEASLRSMTPNTHAMSMLSPKMASHTIADHMNPSIIITENEDRSRIISENLIKYSLTAGLPNQFKTLRECITTL